MVPGQRLRNLLLLATQLARGLHIRVEVAMPNSRLVVAVVDQLKGGGNIWSLF